MTTWMTQFHDSFALSGVAELTGSFCRACVECYGDVTTTLAAGCDANQPYLPVGRRTETAKPLVSDKARFALGHVKFSGKGRLLLVESITTRSQSLDCHC